MGYFGKNNMNRINVPVPTPKLMTMRHALKVFEDT